MSKQSVTNQTRARKCGIEMPNDFSGLYSKKEVCYSKASGVKDSSKLENENLLQMLPKEEIEYFDYTKMDTWVFSPEGNQTLPLVGYDNSENMEELFMEEAYQGNFCCYYFTILFSDVRCTKDLSQCPVKKQSCNLHSS